MYTLLRMSCTRKSPKFSEVPKSPTPTSHHFTFVKWSWEWLQWLSMVCCILNKEKLREIRTSTSSRSNSNRGEWPRHTCFTCMIFIVEYARVQLHVTAEIAKFTLLYRQNLGRVQRNITLFLIDWPWCWSHRQGSKCSLTFQSVARGTVLAYYGGPKTTKKWVPMHALIFPFVGISGVMRHVYR